MDNFLYGNIQIARITLRNLPTSVQIWSYLMVFVPILCIPVYAIYKLFVTPGRNFDEVKTKGMFETSELLFVFQRLQQAVKPEELLLEHIHSRSVGAY